MKSNAYKLFSGVFTLVAAAIVSVPAHAQSLVYVANLGSNTVSVISSAANTVTATIPVGNGPIAVAVTPDGTMAYVANQNDSTVSVINTATSQVITTVPVGGPPGHLAVTPNGAYVYVPNQTANTVSVIATATNAVVTTIPAGTDPNAVVFSPSGALAYVVNDQTVTVIDTTAIAVTTTFPVPSSVGTDGPGVAITPNGSLLYVSGGAGNAAVVNTATDTVTTTLQTNSNLPGTSLGYLAFLPSGAFGYGADGGPGQIAVFDTTNTVVARVSVGAQPIGLAITPNGKFAYTANYGDGTVSVINTAADAVIATVTVGSNPFGLAITSPFIDDDSQYSLLNGGNTFTGNQTVNGNLTATNLSGNGAGLTGVNAASLGGVTAGNYARLDIGNNFNGNQTFAGNERVTGTLTVSGAGNALIFPDGTTQTTAATGGGGTGTITGVTSGTGLTGGGASGNVTVAVDGTVARTNAANVFSGTQTAPGFIASGNVTAGGAVSGASVAAGAGSFSASFNAGPLTIDANGNLATSGSVFGSSPDGAGYFQINANVNTSDALYALHTGYGNAFHALNTQYRGRAGLFEATAPDQTTEGLRATVASPAGTAGVFQNIGNGKILSLQNGAGEVFNVGSASAALAPAGAATSAQGFNSVALDLSASALNSSSGQPQSQLFRWQAEPQGNNTANPSANLNLLFGSAGNAPAETGLSVASNGLISFAPGQAFPGTGDLTGITAGAGLNGGGTSGNVSLGVAPAGITNGMLANPALSVNAGAGLTGGGPVALGGTSTLSLATSTCAAGSVVTAHPFTCTPFPTFGANTFTGNQTMPALSVTGGITAGSVSSANGAFSNNSNTLALYAFSNGGTAVEGASNSNEGVSGLSSSGDGAVGQSNTGYGVVGQSSSSAGVFGIGASDGVIGASDAGNGVFGQSSSGYGVIGTSNSVAGVYGYTLATAAGTAAGVFSNAAAGNAGNIILGQSDDVTKFSVDAKGDVAASGTLTIGAGGTPIVEHLSQSFEVSVSPVTPGNCSTLPVVTLTGASDGDTIALGIKSALIPAATYLDYFAWVSAANTVSIRVCNLKGSTNAGLSGAIRVDVWKH